MNLKDKGAAGIMLSSVIKRASADKKYAKIQEKAQLLLDSLEKQLTGNQEKVSPGVSEG